MLLIGRSIKYSILFPETFLWQSFVLMATENRLAGPLKEVYNKNYRQYVLKLTILVFQHMIEVKRERQERTFLNRLYYCNVAQFVDASYGTEFIWWRKLDLNYFLLQAYRKGVPSYQFSFSFRNKIKILFEEVAKSPSLEQLKGIQTIFN